MAITAPPTSIPKVSFTSRTFTTFVQDFLAFVQATNPGVYTDFATAQLGTMLVDLAGAIVDNCSYGQDIVAQEMFLATCQRYASALRFAKSVGYTPHQAEAASVIIVSQSPLPANLIANGGTIPALAIITGANGLPYELQATYTVNPGDTIIRLTMLQGTTYTETFDATAQQNQTVTTANGIVQQSSWQVFVGDPTNPANLWEQVDNVTFEVSATQTYDVSFNDAGQLTVRFGDGNAGLIPNSTITIIYRTCAGAAGNCPVSAISGAVKVSVTSPGTGTVSVPLLNYDATAAVGGGTQLNSGEAEGTTVASTTQAGHTDLTPVLAGSLVLTVSLTGGGGTLVLTDTGAGTFSVTTNTTGKTLSSSAITYTTGAWSFVLNSAIASGGTFTATYYSVTPPVLSAAQLTGAAAGGENRETLAQIQQNVPAYIRTSDKILTLQDYQDMLAQLDGVALSFVTPYVSSYTGNMVIVACWGNAVVSIQSESSAGFQGAPAPYTQYAQIDTVLVQSIQAYLAASTPLTVAHIILQPTMLWVDVYLGTVTYAIAQDPLVVRAAILAAVVAVFEAATGFAVRLSDIYNAVRSTPGVTYFDIVRVATGTQATSDELQGLTGSGATVSGTLQEPVAVPGTVQITINQPSADIVIEDNQAGGFTLLSGVATIVSGSINYQTGAWTATFSAGLVASQQVTASYANTTADYRQAQVVTEGASVGGDSWPPPPTVVSAPVVTPPFFDGVPLSATRGGSPQVAPWLAGDVLTYAALQDITESADVATRNYWNSVYTFNNEIYYDSTTDPTVEVLAINLRRLVFDMVGM